MTDPITLRAAEELAASNHILVPLHDLYETLVSEGMMSRTKLEMFDYLLASDPRFEIIEGFGDLGILSETTQTQLELQGFWGGPLVMLRSRADEPHALRKDVLYHKERFPSTKGHKATQSKEERTFVRIRVISWPRNEKGSAFLVPGFLSAQE